MTTSPKPTKSKLIPKRQIKPDIVHDNLYKSIKSFTLQRTGCWNPTSKIKIDRCKPCIAKKNEGCRFINIRAFPTSAFENATSTTEYKENDIVLEDDPYFMDYDGPDPISKYKKLTTMMITKTNYRNIVLQKICKAFTKMLQEDSRRVIEHGTLIRRREPLDNVRHVCDMCLTSIFNLHYMCSVCALDLCVDCYDKNWEEKKNSRLAHCTYRRKHTKEHMVPVIKYKTATLEQFKEQSSKMDEDSKKDNVLYSSMTSTDTHLNESVSSKTAKDENSVAKGEAFMSDEDDFLIVDADALTLDSFRACWGMGKPVIVKNVMDKDSQELWSPETFINKYSIEEKEDGSKKRKIKVKTMTEVINCENGFVHETSVENFFEEYINPTLRKGYKKGKPVVLKIKVSVIS
ncbi:hypothetical protein BDC45DRAFT_7627 [Circinella umbellata]|nr:hypothetical protein BDC45DRAFT_7627 [Circinella umbellata]